MNKLSSKRKCVTDAAIASLFAVTFFYLLSIFEVAEPLYIPYKDTAEMMIFYIFFSIFLIAFAFVRDCSRIDAFLLAVTPYAVTSTALALKSHMILCAVMICAALTLSVIKIGIRFAIRNTTAAAKREKTPFRTAAAVSFIAKALSIGCVAVMLVLIVESVYERAIDQYEYRIFWNEHSGMSLDEISDNIALTKKCDIITKELLNR